MIRVWRAQIYIYTHTQYIVQNLPVQSPKGIGKHLSPPVLVQLQRRHAVPAAARTQ